MLIFFFVCQLCQENVSYLEYHKTCGFSRQLCKFTQAFAGEIFFFLGFVYVCLQYVFKSLELPYDRYDSECFSTLVW